MPERNKRPSMQSGISQGKMLAKTILSLIKTRNPDLPDDCAKRESVSYARFIIGKAASGVGNDDWQSTSKELKELHASIKAVISKLDSLSEDSQWHIYMATALDKNILVHEGSDGSEVLKGHVYESDRIMSAILSGLKDRERGRPKQSGKDHFVEAVIQVFEKSSGINFDDLSRLPVKESRKHKTAFYTLLEVSGFDGSASHSFEAFKKFADRYIQDGCMERESVEVDFQDFIFQENLCAPKSDRQ